MKEIFTDLYNKVLGFFRQTEPETAESAKETACNRLRVVLMQDRTNLTPELMERMRREMVELLSKYVEMDKEALELNLEQDGEQVALMLSIPVIRAKDEEEIKAAIRKGTLAVELFPVLCGSAYKDKGVQPMLDAVIDYLPAPTDIPSIKGCLLYTSPSPRD